MDEFDEATVYKMTEADDEKTVFRGKPPVEDSVVEDLSRADDIDGTIYQPSLTPSFGDASGDGSIADDIDGTIYQGSPAQADNSAIDSDTVATPNPIAWFDDKTAISPTAVNPATRTASGEPIPASTRHALIPKTVGNSLGNEAYAPRAASGPERAIRHDFNQPAQRRRRDEPGQVGRSAGRNSSLVPWVVGGFILAAAAIVVLIVVVL